MIGAIIGDIAGSTYEYSGIKDTRFDLFPYESDFTDDSVLTLATAEALLTDGDYQAAYRRLGRMYPNPMGGYGGRFGAWLRSDSLQPYGSYGNGSAMRVGPIGFAFDNLESVLSESERSAAATHNHPEGIRGAQAIACAIFLARTRATKCEIRSHISDRFGYDLTRSVDMIRPAYRFDESCQGTVPEAIIAFLDSHDFESALRLAISLGGDADTLACITGSIAQAFYRHIPVEFIATARRILPEPLLQIADSFAARFPDKENAA